MAMGSSAWLEMNSSDVTSSRTDTALRSWFATSNPTQSFRIDAMTLSAFKATDMSSDRPLMADTFTPLAGYTL